MKNKILIIMVTIIVSFFWFNSIKSILDDTVLIDGITLSVFIVSLLTPVFSVSSWSLLSLIRHNKITISNMIASALLGVIVITPIAQMSGPILAILLGIATGTCLVGFEFLKNRK